MLSTGASPEPSPLQPAAVEPKSKSSTDQVNLVADSSDKLESVDENRLEEASQAPTTGKSMEEDLKEGKGLTDEAFRAFKQGDLEKAVELFSAGLDLMVPHVGQFSEVLGPIYLAYGRTLMQQAIAKGDALLVNKDSVPVTTTASTGQEEAEVAAGKVIDLPDIIPEEEESQDEEEEQAEEEAEGENDDFQLAWEVLDVARLIYSKQKDKPLACQILADIHVDLGDLQMENEQFSAALQDYQAALQILSSETVASDQGDDGKLRAQASVWFKIAMAHEYGGQELKEAIRPLERAIEILQSCTSDVAELLADLTVKLAEVKKAVEKSDLIKDKIINDSAEGFPVPTNPATSSNAPVHDLTAMVKKRPKPAESEHEHEPIPKK